MNYTNELLLLVTVIVALFLYLRRFKETTFGFSGRLIWYDSGVKIQPFKHSQYGVIGKPDYLFKVGWNTYAAVEYKSRRGPVYFSDIVQAKCAALAARGNKFNISFLIVQTEVDRIKVDLPNSDSALYDEISVWVELARRAALRDGTIEKTSYIARCRGCGYKNVCQ